MKFLYSDELTKGYRSEQTILDPYPRKSKQSRDFRKLLTKRLNDNMLVFSCEPFYISPKTEARAIECCVTVPRFLDSIDFCEVNPVGAVSRINMARLRVWDKLLTELSSFSIPTDGKTDLARARAGIIAILDHYPWIKYGATDNRIVMYEESSDEGVIAINYIPSEITVFNDSKLGAAIFIDLKLTFDNVMLRGVGNA